MKTIRISMEVWERIKELGEFGDTPDAVLRRVLDLPKKPPSRSSSITVKWPGKALRPLSCKIVGNDLVLQFLGDKAVHWQLPDLRDHSAIRVVRDQAERWAVTNYASYGQVSAMRKTLTANGYFVRPPSEKGGSSE